MPFNVDGSEQGFDGLAINEDGNLVVIETKVKNANGRVTNSKWLSTKLSTGNRQMSDDWIENNLIKLADDADTERKREFLRRLADDDGIDAIEITEQDGRIVVDDVNEKNIDSQLIAYQDNQQTGRAVSSGLRVEDDTTEPTLDEVDVVKIGDVFN